MIFRLKLLYLLVICSIANAQKPVEYDKMKAFNIIVNYPDHTVKTQMLKDPAKLSANEELTYHWYSSNKIMSTKGGFDGKLLHGYYKSFYLNNNLKESGNFKYGLKKGEWRYWFEDGKLKEIINWKNGKKNGNYRIYNSSGELIGKGSFKNDQLNGKFKTYSKGRLTETLSYKKGEAIPKKQKVRKAKVAKMEETTGSPAENTKKEKKTVKERWNNTFKKGDKGIQKKADTKKEEKKSATKKEKEVKKKKEEKPKKEKKPKEAKKKEKKKPRPDETKK